MPIFSAGSASVSIVPDFAGAQKAIGAFFAEQRDLHVTVQADLANGDMARIEAELNAGHGTATVNVDRNALRSDISSAITDAVSTNVGLAGLSSLLSASFKPAMLSAVGGALTEVAAAASQAVGVVALIPAGLLAAAAPAATLAIGLQGVGNAFKALDTGNLDKINAAMAKLAPAAQDFVLQVHALAPAWTALRLDVQQALLAGVGTEVTNLANTALPILRTGLHGVADDLNIGIKSALATLQGLGPQFTTIFGNITVAGQSLAGTMSPLIDAFVRLGAVGSQFLPGIAQGLLNAANAADRWVQSAEQTGQLTAIIQAALNVLKQLGEIAINVGSILVGVFQAALPFGNILLGLLVQLTGGLATFIHSADGQTALTAFFSGVQTAVSALAGPLQTLIEALVSFLLPALGSLAAALAPIAGQLLTQLAAVLQQVAGIVPPVVSVIAALVSALAPLIPVIGQLITTLLPPLVAVLASLAPVIGQITTLIGQGLLAVVQAITPFLQPIGAAFVAILQAMTPLIPVIAQVAAILGQALATAVLAVLQAITPIVPVFVQLAQTILPPLASMFGALVAALSPLIVAFGQALAQALQILVPLFAPIFGALQQIMAAVQPLIPLLVQLVQQAFTAWAAEMVVVIQAITPLLPLLGQLVVQLVPPLIQVLSALIPIVAQVGGIIATALVQAITILAPLIPPVVTAFAQLLTALLPLIPPLVQLGATILVAAAQAFAQLVTALLPLIPPITQLVSALIPPLTQLIAALSPLIAPLANAFVQVVTALVPLLPLFVQLIQELLPPLIQLFILLAPPLITLATKFLELQATIVTWIANVLGWFADFGTKWNTFWTNVANFIKTTWNDFISWIQNLWTGWDTWLSDQEAKLGAAWNQFWLDIGNYIKNTWNDFISWVKQLWTDFTTWLGQERDKFAAAWNQFWLDIGNYIKNTWNDFINWVKQLWSDFTGWLATERDKFAAAWNQFWLDIGNYIKNTWNDFINWVKGVWTDFTSWLSDKWNTFKTDWGNVWDWVGQKFSDVWNSIKQTAQDVWGLIKGIIATPVEFLINTVLIGGLFKGWNLVVDAIGLSNLEVKMDTVSFDKGGYTGDYGLFGTSSPQDPAGIVHAREFVFTANQVDNAGGPSAMYALASQLDSGYAMGGLVRNQASDPGLHMGSYVVSPNIAPRVHRFLDALSSGQAEAVQAAGGFDAIGPGFFYGGFADAVTAGVAFANSQVGKPYVWGAVGPNGYDCSGFQSAITNVLSGSGAPFSRVGTTANFPWAGFTPGEGTYTIGSSPNFQNSGTGHMAGTLSGLNVESAGGVGVRTGAGAWGALHSGFTIQALMNAIGTANPPGAGAGGGASTLTIAGQVISTAADVLALLGASIASGVANLIGQFGDNNWTQTLAAVPGKLRDHMWDKIKDNVTAYIAQFSANVSGSGSTPSGGAPALKDQAYTIARSFGWTTAAEDAAIDYIVSHESGWNPTAQNPTSTASGLWQMIDGTWRAYRPNTASGYAHAKDAPTDLQDDAGLSYIQAAYGDPIAAMVHWQSAHSYDNGGPLPPGYTSVVNQTGGFEYVLNQAKMQAVAGSVLTPRYDGVPTWHFYLGDREITDLVDARVTQWNDRDGRNFRSSM